MAEKVSDLSSFAVETKSRPGSKISPKHQITCRGIDPITGLRGTRYFELTSRASMQPIHALGTSIVVSKWHNRPQRRWQVADGRR